MIRTFADLALSGKPDPSWCERALNAPRVIDACLQSDREGGKLEGVF